MSYVTLATCTTVLPPSPQPVSESRRERKQRTRADLLAGGAAAARRTTSFSSLSLREVTREAGVVPTAFYRHFANMEELGLALVDESFRTLRADDPLGPGGDERPST